VGDAVEHDPAVEHIMPSGTAPPLSDDGNGELAASLAQAARQCGAMGLPCGVPYGTDAPAFADRGIPTVVFGPGSIAQAHTADEWIEVDQLQSAEEILFRFCLNECR